jgi:LPPG:FO 2-phospho-L-lactate transferase
LKIVVLAGGVGGAKLVEGFARLLSPEEFSVIVNTGDDFEYLSLKISPDLDTVCYTLAGKANPQTGWGIKDDSFNTMKAVADLDGPDWFRLGDNDLATHLVRTEMLLGGASLSEVTREFCRNWGIQHPVYPMSNDPVRTIVHTSAGESLGFQDYFVHQACQPVVSSFEFAGIEQAKPVPEALRAIEDCDAVIFAPSNPWVSIDPILAVRGYRSAIGRKPVIAVSPLIGGKALKGPAAKMYRELGILPSASAVANHYKDLLLGYVFDHADEGDLDKIKGWFIIPLVTDIIMKDQQDRVRLAREIIEFCESILNRSC